MGNKLEAYFQQAEKLAGMKGKVKLAMITKLSNKDAVTAPDSEDNIAKFEAALALIKKEFG